MILYRACNSSISWKSKELENHEVSKVLPRILNHTTKLVVLDVHIRRWRSNTYQSPQLSQNDKSTKKFTSTGRNKASLCEIVQPTFFPLVTRTWFFMVQQDASNQTENLSYFLRAFLSDISSFKDLSITNSKITDRGKTLGESSYAN